MKDTSKRLWVENGSFPVYWEEAPQEAYDAAVDGPYRTCITAGGDPNENGDLIVGYGSDHLRKYSVKVRNGDGESVTVIEAASLNLAAQAMQATFGDNLVSVAPQGKRVLLVGRHTSGDMGVDVVSQKSVTFPTDQAGALAALEELWEECKKTNCSLLLQNTPGVVTAALFEALYKYGTLLAETGVIISKAGPRPAGKVVEFDPQLLNRYYAEDVYKEGIAKFAKAIDPRVNVDGYTVTCDPPMNFVFDRIEWF